MDKQDEILSKLQDITSRLEKIETIIKQKPVIPYDFVDPLLSEVILYIRTKDIIDLNEIQKQFNIGYARLARIQDELTNLGYIQNTDDENKIKVINKTKTDFPELKTNDSLLSEAIEIIKKFDRASASLLQRRLKIGYAKAAKILDLLEEKGYVSAAQGSQPREVIRTKSSIIKSILFVEDDELLRNLYNEVLKNTEYKIDFAVDGQQGLNKIKSNKYDLIILGIMLPKMNGIEVLEKLANEKIYNGKIVMFTNLDNKELKNKAYNLGVFDYWIKSELTPNDILKKINNISSFAK